MFDITVHPIFAWYDLWVGFYIDRAKRRFYCFPLPTLGFYIEWKAKPKPAGERKLPSSFFLRAFTAHTSGCRNICEFCGRQFFASRADFDFNEGELEELERREKEEPDRCIDFVSDSVHIGSIGGKTFVYGCPCEQAALHQYEAFVWSHRRQIIEYLTKITKERKREADENNAEATAVEKAVEEAFQREEDFGREMECREMLKRVTSLIDETEWARKRIPSGDKEKEKSMQYDFDRLLDQMRGIKSKLQEKIKEEK